jgi:hypothetical protein
LRGRLMALPTGRGKNPREEETTLISQS